ncbi:nitronate monooxygenase [Streptomyces indicus]|uniref:Nitronate monooxygenase n=1 Tax=Streptomyces indicus TaxID=417292 RepID=A0A1G9GKT7_9ACTN|nr:nitronate monooxygenase [Streptomyces indicus]SDL01289.1 Nitronate monooxygenase [Streptomyces indicus]
MPTATEQAALPKVIQGGMGVGVSGWRLARAVSRTGQLGVVSGTALDAVLARRLQLGDPGGDVRRALAAFPVPALAAAVLDRYYVPGGVADGERFRTEPMLRAERGEAADLLTVLGNFVEVWLAKEGHEGLVGVNYLAKIELAVAPALFGAILAGVDHIIVGAGVPAHLPELATRLSRAEPVTVMITVDGDEAPCEHRFDPRALLSAEASAEEAPGCGGGVGGDGCQCGGTVPGETGPAGSATGDTKPKRSVGRVQDVTIGPRPTPAGGLSAEVIAGLRRPAVLAVVSLPVLAAYLARDEATRPDGFVIETPGAGGHSAPPRGALTLDENGEPVYGPRDVPDLAKMAKLGIPFWLAGGAAHPARLASALSAGAAGVQVGSAFALCEESGMEESLLTAAKSRARKGTLRVRNDPDASPTSFPFKVADLPGTLSESSVVEARRRVCDLGYLRVPYRTAKGAIGYRCPAEPHAAYARKGGEPTDVEGRLCLCNGLLATVGLGQRRPGGTVEAPLVTLGRDLSFLEELSPEGEAYAAEDVVKWLVGS